MQILSGRKLLTCRYWAFGPRCPDVDGQGVAFCPYAHWDTGRLSDYYEQRGTCYDWVRGKPCPWGQNCAYEHRDTGYMGLYQGRLQLSGMNLRIADAAARSGFNTRNQVALLDLIWAVRRVAFVHAVETPSVNRPPKHPIYPDRYRPGGRADGDNTQISRKRGRGKTITGGTSDNPIDLDADSAGNGGGGRPATSTKRQMVFKGQTGPHHVPKIPTGPRNPVHPSRFHQVPNPSRNQRRPSPVPKIQSPSLMPEDRLTAPPPYHERRPLIEQSITNQTLRGLGDVDTAMKGINETIEKCFGWMKDLFEQDEKLRSDTVVGVLMTLKKDMNLVSTAADEGRKDVEELMGFVKDDGVEVT